MRYIEEVTWSAHWGLSNFLQPGEGDAQPQTSGAFRLHHFASLGAAALPSLSPLSLYLTDLGFFKPEPLGSDCYMRPAAFRVKKCGFSALVC